MVKAYFEWRVSAARGTDSLAADITRHLHSRQNLEKIVIICDQPIAMLSAVRKQWLKLSRTIQRQRAATLNADKILKYTHTIARMQKMRFTTKEPYDQPDADVFCISLGMTSLLPPTCFSLYITQKVTLSEARALVRQMPRESLVIDYAHSMAWKELGLISKKVLEDAVFMRWKELSDFATTRGINPAALYVNSVPDVEAMDSALDILLEVGGEFLDVANMFQHALEIARPLRVNKTIRMQYDALVLLAHRVQALSPGAFSQRFLESYNEDDNTFFLYDPARDHFLEMGESLRQTVLKHRAAGRHRLASALVAARFAGNRLLPF